MKTSRAAGELIESSWLPIHCAPTSGQTVLLADDSGNQCLACWSTEHQLWQALDTGGGFKPTRWAELNHQPLWR